MTAHQVDVLLAVVVHRSLQAQLLVNGLVEGLTEVGYLLDKLFQFLQLQTEEHRRCHGTDTDRRLCIVQQVGLAKEFAVTQQGNTQFLTVRSLADDLSLSAGYDEELLLVFTFFHKEFAQFHLNGLEATCQTVHNLVVEL